ncbi:hypothetical protein [Acidipropionibacterium jensenii]|uniref:hypothetical protein n=1 Tax=Acidipropionibacterium jensenii TaxID=1749 RepID=UPI000BC35909|nr:hypothetical protein [Acidipropionibacterium jensenii]
MRPPVVITSRSGRIGTAALAVAALALLVWDATRAGLLQALVNAPFVALFVWCAWIFWGLASIRIDNDGVHVINQLRIWDVPWAQLKTVTGRWGVTLTTLPQDSSRAPENSEASETTGADESTEMGGTSESTGAGGTPGTGETRPARGHSIRAWAAPAKGTAGKIIGTDRELPIIPDQGHEPIRISLDAFAAARLIEIEQIQRRAGATPSDAAPVRVRVNWPTVIISAVLVTLAVLS